jgi:hypothetical protein
MPMLFIPILRSKCGNARSRHNKSGPFRSHDLAIGQTEFAVSSELQVCFFQGEPWVQCCYKGKEGDDVSGKGVLARLARSLGLIAGWWILPMALVSCAIASYSAKPRPKPPPFTGEETEWWLVQQTEPVGRGDVLPAFEASAQSYGCNTEELGGDFTATISGELRTYYGIRQACDVLLRRIAEAR